MQEEIVVGDIIIIIVGNLIVDFELWFILFGVVVVNFIVVLMFWIYDCQIGEWKDGEVLFFWCNIWWEVVENVVESFIWGV